ncbi:hypothetical protein ACN47E_009989 [Coniothyrium glycines]
MPLQKLPPRHQPANDPHASKRGQLQERRRTLQTISELAATDGAHDDFKTFMKSRTKGHGNGSAQMVHRQRTPNLSKRRSLPQYCSSPACLQAQHSAQRQRRLHTCRSPKLQRSFDRPVGTASLRDQGWNEKREKARAQLEQTAILMYDSQTIQDGKNVLGCPSTDAQHGLVTPDVVTAGHFTPRVGAQQVLRNSRSLSGIQSSQQQRQHVPRSNLARTHEQQQKQHDCETESSGRTSTDSSSHRSSHERAVRRSRSGSSSDTSISSHQPPLVPVLSIPRMQRYYSMPTQLHYNQAALQSALSTPQSRHIVANRVPSLPSIRIEHVGAPPSDTKHKYTEQQKHQMTIQRARLESLAALTAAQGGAPSIPKDVSPFLGTHRNSLPSQQDRCSSNQGRPRSESHLRPPPQYTPYHKQRVGPQVKTTAHTRHEAPAGAARRIEAQASLEPRPVPTRESLTRWKTEREEARAEFEGLQRAKMRERVRRANEMEVEKEKELLKMGKGTTVVDEVEDEDENEDENEDKDEGGSELDAGCLGGVLKMLWKKKS